MKLISNLPKDIRELAELRRSEQPEFCKFWDGDPDKLSYAFKWSDTPEKKDFWGEIYYQGNYQPYYDLYPNHEWRQPVFEWGEEVEVRDSDIDDWKSRLYLITIKGARLPYICLTRGHEEAFKKGQLFSTCAWEQIRKKEKETVLTLSEATQILSDKLGKKVRIDTEK